MKLLITKDIWIEDVLRKYPEAQEFLSKKGIVCVVCGEPVWGSIEEHMGEKGFSQEEIDKTLLELNEFIKTAEFEK
ncbi:MAG: DUF1858 domain-containing protein [Candidatus Cloacimonetes bacterium]|nr:DUF1858 domain-containing protein [Candidatus Cloacimonadota bacterium]